MKKKTDYGKITVDALRRATGKMTKEHKKYLDKLRESGETNMFGAGEYLEMRFGLDRKEAREILSQWMNSFKS